MLERMNGSQSQASFAVLAKRNGYWLGMRALVEQGEGAYLVALRLRVAPGPELDISSPIGMAAAFPRIQFLRILDDHCSSVYLLLSTEHLDQVLSGMPLQQTVHAILTRIPEEAMVTTEEELLQTLQEDFEKVVNELKPAGKPQTDAKVIPFTIPPSHKG